MMLHFKLWDNFRKSIDFASIRFSIPTIWMFNWGLGGSYITEVKLYHFICYNTISK